jgi:hypothetical protein
MFSTGHEHPNIFLSFNMTRTADEFGLNGVPTKGWTISSPSYALLRKSEAMLEKETQPQA